jgi:hypothetical protein
MLFRPDNKTRHRRLPALVLFFVSASASICWGAPQDETITRPGESACCIDASGQLVCGDIMPPQCNGRALKIYNRQGLLIRSVSPRMTEAEKAQVTEQDRLEKQMQTSLREQQRKDQALLDTYTSLADLDRMQKRREEETLSVIANTRAMLAAAKQRKQALDAEAEFYAKTPDSMPPDLSQRKYNEEIEIKAQNNLLDAKQKELEQIRKKFAEDRRRYIAITGKGANKQ